MSLGGSMRQRQVLVLALAVLLGLSTHVANAEHGPKLGMSEFKACVEGCEKVLMDCWRPMIPLLDTFTNHVKKVIKKLSTCCLKGEHEHDIPVDTSFATCTRDKCAARLWGCTFKKTHSGAKSIAEREFIKKKKKGKK